MIHTKAYILIMIPNCFHTFVHAFGAHYLQYHFTCIFTTHFSLSSLFNYNPLSRPLVPHSWFSFSFCLALPFLFSSLAYIFYFNLFLFFVFCFSFSFFFFLSTLAFQYSLTQLYMPRYMYQYFLLKELTTIS